MATTYTIEDLQDLETALATGALRVTHGGTSTEFRSRDDMLRQVALMRQELGLPPDDVPRTTPAIRKLRYIVSKGL